MEFIRQNIIWVMLAVVSGTMLLASIIRGRGAGTGASPLEATLLINREDALVLDVRDGPAYSTGHIPNARNIPAADLKNRLSELEKYKKKPCIVYCQRGTTSNASREVLASAGFERVIKLAGGIEAWEQAGQPTAKI